MCIVNNYENASLLVNMRKSANIVIAKRTHYKNRVCHVFGSTLLLKAGEIDCLCFVNGKFFNSIFVSKAIIARIK